MILLNSDVLVHIEPNIRRLIRKTAVTIAKIYLITEIIQYLYRYNCFKYN